MEKFARITNDLEIEIVSDDEFRKKSWSQAKRELEKRGLRLPTPEELECARKFLYLNHVGNFDEGSEYWTSDIKDRFTHAEAYKTIVMSYKRIHASKYEYSEVRYRGVRDI